MSLAAVIIEAGSVGLGRKHKQVSGQRFIVMHLFLLPQLFRKYKVCSTLLPLFISPLAVLLIKSLNVAD